MTTTSTARRHVRIGVALFISTCALLASPAGVHAAPNADATEEEGVCEILDNNGGDYHLAFKLAVIAVKGDTGMSDGDAVRFARKAISDRCQVYADKVG